VSGPKASVDAFLQKAAGKDKNELPLSFNSLVPQNLKAKRYQNAKQRSVAGMPGNEDFNWYDWNVDHWGCKWDCCHVELEVDETDSTKTATFRFDTPWAPPTKFLEKVTAKFKDLSFDAYAWEPGMSFWCHFYGNKGVIQDEESIDIDQIEKLDAAIIDRLDFLGFETTGGDIGKIRDSLENWYLDEGDLSEIPEACVIIEDDEYVFKNLAKEAGFKEK
jgi:hypothetical protein